MAQNFIELTNDSNFVEQLNQAGNRLVVADFYATWCGPCNLIAPFFKQLCAKYTNAIFMKIDVDKCPGSASANNVTAMPTFIIFRNRMELVRIKGADKTLLENKVKEHLNSETSEKSNETNNILEGDYVDLANLINKSQSECLNQADDHPWENILNTSPSSFLLSDVDEQLLLYVSFLQPVKLNSLIIQGPKENGPKNIRIFINQTRTLDFESAENCQSIQDVELKSEDIEDNHLIKLKYVKFQNVQNITLFFVKNQNDTDNTQINYIAFIGSPLNVTNMNEFKRVSGQAGESHG